MKVCHITSAHQQNDDRIFLKQCSSLAHNGFEVHLIVLNGSTEKTNNVNIIGIPFASKSRLGRMYKGVNLCYKQALMIDADLYQIHDPELLRILPKLKKKGKKVIYDAHEDVPKQILGKYWIPSSMRKLIAKLFKEYENRIASKLDHVIVATPQMIERFVQKVPTTALSNYPLLSEFQVIPKKTSLKKEICYIGKINLQRGIKEIMETLTQLKGFKLHLAGDFSPENLKNQIKQYESWEQTEFYGYVGREEVLEILIKVSIGMVTLHDVPAFRVAQPIKLFEYMAAGIPVVSGDYPIMKELVEGNACGICVDPQSVEEIKDALDFMIDNPEKALEMGKNGRKAVQEKYSWEQEAIRMKNIYINLLNAG